MLLNKFRELRSQMGIDAPIKKFDIEYEKSPPTYIAPERMNPPPQEDVLSVYPGNVGDGTVTDSKIDVDDKPIIPTRKLYHPRIKQ